jgi:hypothetical protein
MKKIEFYSTVPGLPDMYPIVKAKDCLPSWAKSARDSYIKKKDKNIGRMNHIFQCPGIFDLFNQGYIVPMWHDVIINTNGDPDNFTWTVPSSDLAELTPEVNIIETQSNGIGSVMPTKPWSLNTLIKVNTPWHVVAPRGVKLLIMPIAYPDSFEFESSIGLLNPGYANEINIQMYYNVQKGDVLIKAGTPLAHIIPLSENNYELVCREMNNIDKFWQAKKKYFNSANFKIRRNIIQDLYYKHFRKEK